MGERAKAWRWRRYQRGLRTIPAIVLVSLIAWALAGGGYFWPKWVLLWAAVAMSFRAMRAMRNDEAHDETVGELSEAAMQMPWPPSRSAARQTGNS